MAIENDNTIDERRSKIVRKRVFDCRLSPDCKFFLVALVSDCFCYVFSRPILNKHFRERQSKMSNISTNADPGSLETELLPAVCRPTGDKWQSKTQFQAICDPRSSIVESAFDCRLSNMIKESILC